MRCFSQKPRTKASVRTRATPANLTRPWKLIRVLATSTCHRTERPRDGEVPVEDEAEVFGPPGEESVDVAPVARVPHVRGHELLPAVGTPPEGRSSLATARGYLRAPDLRSWLDARDVLDAIGEPLRERTVPTPEPGPDHVRLSIGACGVCRTDLHVIDGDLADPALPLVLGHQVVGVVDALGTDVETLELGLRVGVPWLGWTCGTCRFCRSGRENLCPEARFTGFQLPGGFAEGMVVDARSCLPIPRGYPGPAGGSVALCRVDRLAVPEARGRPTDWGSTASARPPISSRRSRAGRDASCSRSHAPATSALRRSRASSDAHGRVAPMSTRPRSSMPRSSSRRPVSSCRALWPPSPRGARWCAARST